jgi:hypothetical protein
MDGWVGWVGWRVGGWFMCVSLYCLTESGNSRLALFGSDGYWFLEYCVLSVIC